MKNLKACIASTFLESVDCCSIPGLAQNHCDEKFQHKNIPILKKPITAVPFVSSDALGSQFSLEFETYVRTNEYYHCYNFRSNKPI